VTYWQLASTQQACTTQPPCATCAPATWMLRWPTGHVLQADLRRWTHCRCVNGEE